MSASPGSEHSTPAPAIPATPPPWCVTEPPLDGWPEGRTRSRIRAGTDPIAPIIAKVTCAAEWQDDPAERLANAHLMAAAPELYAALYTLVALLRGDPARITVERAEFVVGAGEGALGRARGETL